ncbi:hypothetical protein RND81_14G078100 [Saponaria officinalis]|uniref:ARGOS-like protein n=1 Tax=Saponaria officinalis TaxID=3572 RepID=A0AAW1GMJ9_SAPOF
MISEFQEPNKKLPKSLFTLQTHSSEAVPTKPRTRKPDPSTLRMAGRGAYDSRDEGLKHEREYHRLSTQGSLKKSKRGGYFGLESMLLLVCLAASMLILPVILPPLPPPPFLLLLLPIGIFGLLMILAFMPSNVRDLTYM